MSSNNDRGTDIFNYPLFLGAYVVTSIINGDRSVLRYGKVTEYVEERDEIRITGGNCKIGLWRSPKDCIIIPDPENKRG